MRAASFTTSGTTPLTYDVTLDWAEPSGGGLSGSGTTNVIAKWTGATALGNSFITDNGANTITLDPDGTAALLGYPFKPDTCASNEVLTYDVTAGGIICKPVGVGVACLPQVQADGSMGVSRLCTLTEVPGTPLEMDADSGAFLPDADSSQEIGFQNQSWAKLWGRTLGSGKRTSDGLCHPLTFTTESTGGQESTSVTRATISCAPFEDGPATFTLNTAHLLMNANEIRQVGGILPNADNSIAIGSSGARWARIWTPIVNSANSTLALRTFDNNSTSVDRLSFNAGQSIMNATATWGVTTIYPRADLGTILGDFPSRFGAVFTRSLYIGNVQFDSDADGTGNPCLTESEADSRIYHDTNCDGTKNEGEDWINLARSDTSRRTGYLQAMGFGVTQYASVACAGGPSPSTQGNVTRHPDIADRLYYKYETTFDMTDEFSSIACGINTRPRYRPKAEFRIRTSSALTTMRLWVGLHEQDPYTLAPTTDSAASTNDYVAVGYQPSVSANWLCCSGNGTTHGCVSMGVAPSADTEYHVKVNWSVAGTLTCTVNGTSVSKTDYLSTAAVNLSTGVYLTTLDDVYREFYWSQLAVEQN